ncbi:MAG: arylsulfatase, partial [Lentisphaerae bacterium]
SHSYDGHMFDANGNRREFPEGRYRADVLTDWAIEYLENRTNDRPFFLFISYIEPHHQNDHNCYEGPHGSKEKFANFHVPGDLEGTEGDWRENYPDYLGAINSLDMNLGRIRECLQRLGSLDNTLVVFTSDHGSHFRTRNSEYKRSCHDGCTHIPMVLCGPGFRGGVRYREMVSLLDLPTTLLAAAGDPRYREFRRRPLQELTQALDAEQPWPDDVYIQISESQCGRAIRTHRWKYSVRAPDVPRDALYAERYVEDFLYDLENDPHERNNLVADPNYRSVREELRERLLRNMREANEPPAEIIPCESVE